MTENEDLFSSSSTVSKSQRRTERKQKCTKEEPKKMKIKRSIRLQRFTIKLSFPLQKIHFCGKSKLELALKKNPVYL